MNQSGKRSGSPRLPSSLDRLCPLMKEYRTQEKNILGVLVDGLPRHEAIHVSHPRIRVFTSHWSTRSASSKLLSDERSFMGETKPSVSSYTAVINTAARAISFDGVGKEIKVAGRHAASRLAEHPRSISRAVTAKGLTCMDNVDGEPSSSFFNFVARVCKLGRV